VTILERGYSTIELFNIMTIRQESGEEWESRGTSHPSAWGLCCSPPLNHTTVWTRKFFSRTFFLSNLEIRCSQLLLITFSKPRHILRKSWINYTWCNRYRSRVCISEWVHSKNTSLGENTSVGNEIFTKSCAEFFFPTHHNQLSKHELETKFKSCIELSIETTPSTFSSFSSRLMPLR